MKFTYLRNRAGQIVGCIASQLVDSPKLQGVGKFVSYGLSVHNPHDAFDRKFGREVAAGRMLRSPRELLVTNDRLNHPAIMDAIMLDIYSNQLLSMRVVRVAQDYLLARSAVASQSVSNP